MAHLLIITAHADDLEFFCGGTIIQAIERGHSADLIIVTDSARGYADTDMDNQEVGQLRSREAQMAADIIGLRQVVCLGYPDGFLGDTPTNVLREQLMRRIRTDKPQVVFTFDPADLTEWHPDHRAVANAASQAARFARLPLYHPEHAREGLGSHLVPEIYYFAKKPVSADLVVDVAGQLDKQIKALLAHQSQMRFLVYLAWQEANALGVPEERLESVNPEQAEEAMARAVRRRARDLGAHNGLEATEVFRREYINASALLQPDDWQDKRFL